MAASGNWIYYEQTGKDTVPASAAGTGTVDTVGTRLIGSKSVAQVNTTTLTGTTGSATITIEGVPFVIPFSVDLNTTARNFVRASGFTVDNLGVSVYAPGNDTLVFTAKVPGAAFAISNLINDTGDLAGTTAATVANAVGINLEELGYDTFIYDAAQSEVRKIVDYNGNIGILDKAFTADLTGAAFVYVKGQDNGAMPREISITNTGAAAALFNTENYPEGLTVTDSEIMIGVGSQLDRCYPVVFDAAGTTASITLRY